jgi:hypothetical protein
MRHQVNFKFRDSDDSRQAIRTTSQNRADTGKQLREGERFSQIIISTEVSPLIRSLTSSRGQKDHGWLATFGSKSAEDGPTIQTWKHDIE